MNWHDGEPSEPGLYWVRGPHSEYSPRVELLGVVRVRQGPRGGRRKPRWLEPVRRECHWRTEWEWAWAWTDMEVADELGRR